MWCSWGPCASQEGWGRHSPETLALPGGFERGVAFPRPCRTCWQARAGVSAGVYTRTRVSTCCARIDGCNHAHRRRSSPGACGCQRAACQLSPFSATPLAPLAGEVVGIHTQITAGETCEIVNVIKRMLLLCGWALTDLTVSESLRQLCQRHVCVWGIYAVFPASAGPRLRTAWDPCFRTGQGRPAHPRAAFPGCLQQE